MTLRSRLSHTVNHASIRNDYEQDIEINRLKSEIEKLKKANKKNVFLILSIGAVILAAFYIEDNLIKPYASQISKENGFLIEPLKANLLETNYPWQLDKSGTLTVNIENSRILSQDKIDVIKDSILSNDIIGKDEISTSENLQYGSYYKGWTGALTQISVDNPMYNIPKKFNLIESGDDQGDILIKLTSDKDPQGELGYTKLTLNNDHVVKATITVFNVDKLSDNDLSIIIRHEFGHALGLGHATDKSDLMHDVIDTKYGYITNCDVQALSKLYGGQKSSEIICDR